MIDISGISYFLPIATFVLIFVVVFAILKKTEILGDNNFTMAIIGLIMAVIFVSFSDVRAYLEAVSPWFVVILILMFFVLLLSGFLLAKDITKIARPGVAWVFIALVALAFILIAYNHFGLACNSTFLTIKHWVYEEDVSGSIVLGIVALVVGIFITRKIKKD